MQCNLIGALFSSSSGARVAAQRRHVHCPRRRVREGRPRGAGGGGESGDAEDAGNIHVSTAGVCLSIPRF
jgi:hypothetical protein